MKKLLVVFVIIVSIIGCYKAQQLNSVDTCHENVKEYLEMGNRIKATNSSSWGTYLYLREYFSCVKASQ